MANPSKEKLPNLYLLKVNINNALSSNNTQNSNQTIGISSSYSVDLKDIIFGSLNNTKSDYSNFLSQMLKNYKIDLLNFYYIDNKLFFEIKLEAKMNNLNKSLLISTLSDLLIATSLYFYRYSNIELNTLKKNLSSLNSRLNVIKQKSKVFQEDK